MNEVYHNHFRLRGMHSANGFALQSAFFYLLMTTYAIWDEHRCFRIHSRTSGNYAAVQQRQSVTLPHFIFKAACALADGSGAASEDSEVDF
jgi:hypothetical protein